MNVQDWCTQNLNIFVDVGLAVGRVADEMNEVTRLVQAHSSLTAPPVTGALARMCSAAQECGRVTDRALALPEIPDPATEVQFRDAMRLRQRWVAAVLEFGQTRSLADIDRVEQLGAEATKQGALIEADLRRAWPE